MKQPGPKGGVAIPAQPPAAPSSLSLPAQLIWHDIVRALPPDWFAPENLGLLEAYSVSLATLRVLNGATQRILGKMTEGEDYSAIFMQDLERLRMLAGKETATLANLATKMRLTQQARQAPTKGRGSGNSDHPPWTEE